MIRKFLVAAGVLALLAAASPLPAVAATSPNHCVSRVQGQRTSGELKLGPERCYTSFALAMTAEQVVAWGEGASAVVVGESAATFTLAIHYDRANRDPGGGTKSVVGSSCAGYVNMDTAWNNRVSSTANGCPTIRHYDLINKGGASVVTSPPGGNLGTLSNKVSSVSYA